MKNLFLTFLFTSILMLSGCGEAPRATPSETGTPVVPIVTPTPADSNVSPMATPVKQTATPTTNYSGEIKIQSLANIDNATMQKMHDALTDLFTDAKSRGYTKYLKHSDYTIVVRADCQPAPESGTMSWQQDTPGYGLIWQAERVEIRTGNVQSFQICKDNSETMGNTTRFGAEHIILYFNDMAEFERTKIHSTPELGHPIIK